MGLFGSIGKIFSTAAKAVATGGLSIVAPRLIPAPISQALDVVAKVQFPTTFRQISDIGVAAATRNPALLLPVAPANAGGPPMALNIGGILGQVGTIFGGSQNPFFQGISNVAGLGSSILTSAQAQVPGMPVPVPIKPVLPAAARVGAMIGRNFFNRFPNLGLAIQNFRNMGRRVTRQQLWSLLKRFGPDVLIAGGILSAAAISELMIAGPGRRRMNPGNAKALRRSLRRLEAFHRLCVRADSFRRPARRGSKKCAPSGTQFVRQG